MKKEKNGGILALLGCNSVKIFEKTLTVWPLLRIVVGGGCFLEKKSDLKMERRM